jgi:hypothetical protein
MGQLRGNGVDVFLVDSLSSPSNLQSVISRGGGGRKGEERKDVVYGRGKGRGGL